MSKKRFGYIFGAAAVILLVTTAIFNNSWHNGSGGTVNTTAVSSNTMTISNYMFEPMEIKVRVGTKVTWTNQDAVHHSITADEVSQNAPNSPLIGKGETYSFTFTKAGTYKLHCMPHPYMHATLLVTN